MLKTKIIDAPQIRLSFWDRTGPPVVLRVRVAQSFWHKAKGLAWQKQMCEDGLLFAFDKPARPAFWMLGMRFALDMIWMDARGQVVGWQDHLQPPKHPIWSAFFPWNLPRFRPHCPIAFALEMPAGKRRDWRIDENTVFEILP